MEDKNVYRFHANFRRFGKLEGIFTATPEDVEEKIGEHLYYGEVLGKHSEIQLDLKEKHINLVSEDSEDVETIERLFDGSFGHTPWTTW